MRKIIKSPTTIFFLLSTMLLLFFFLVPLELFDGEIVFEQGLQKFTHQAPLSLSYFIGIGLNQDELVGIKDFYLLPKGYIMAFIFIIGLPALAAYRIKLGKKKSA